MIGGVLLADAAASESSTKPPIRDMDIAGTALFYVRYRPMADTQA